MFQDKTFEYDYEAERRVREEFSNLFEIDHSFKNLDYDDMVKRKSLDPIFNIGEACYRKIFFHLDNQLRLYHPDSHPKWAEL